MKYASAAAFRMALEQRINASSVASGTSVQRLRKVLTFDRYLARLQHVAPGRFILKGGLALDYRLDQRGRATKDIDMVRTDGEQQASIDLQRAAGADIGDHFVFEVTRSTIASGEHEAGAHVGHFRLRATVAGRLFEEVLLDLNYTGPVLGTTDDLTGPPMLAFADIAPATISAIAIEQHLAEKLHALTRTYAGGRTSSRAKDLVDVLLITTAFELDAVKLRAAIAAIFDARGTQPIPTELPRPSRNWRTSYAKLAQEVGVNDNLDEAHLAARAFFEPLIHGDQLTTWTPVKARWNT